MNFKKRHIFFIKLSLIFFLNHRLQAQYSRNIDSLQKVLTTSLPDSTKVNVLSDIGGYQIRKREFDKALKNFTEALNLAQITNYKLGLSNVLQRIGILYMNQNNYSEATEYYVKAIALKKELGDKKGIADVTSNMGIVYSDQGEYSKAIANYFEALKIREEINDTQGTAISLISIANIYYLQNDFKTALDYYFQSLKIKDIYEYKPFIAEVHSNIGLTYLHLNDYTKALEYFNSSMKLDEELGDKQGIAIAKSNIADVYAKREDYTKALSLLIQSRDVFEEIGDIKGQAEIYYELGNIYDSINQPDKAIECFNEQLSLAREIRSRVNIKNAYLGLSAANKKNNNYTEAYRFYTLFKAMEDSLQNESGNKTIAELEAKYKNEKKEKEIELLKTEQQLKDAENRRQTQLIFAGVAIAVAVSISLALLYNRRQLQKKNALERKNFELEKNALASQMNPHFIFNSLGSISGFIAENEKDKAIEYLGVFSKLIRINLEQSREPLVSVTQEAAMLRSYLHLEQLRFENKFNYSVVVGDNVEATTGLPPMFIQPYVENAILHGVIPKEGTGTILVKFNMIGEELVCEVIDDGIGIEESKHRKSSFHTGQKSLAMIIAQERKEIINSKNKQKIQILVNEGNKIEGTIVKLVFPLEFV